MRGPEKGRRKDLSATMDKEKARGVGAVCVRIDNDSRDVTAVVVVVVVVVVGDDEAEMGEAEARESWRGGVGGFCGKHALGRQRKERAGACFHGERTFLAIPTTHTTN